MCCMWHWTENSCYVSFAFWLMLVSLDKVFLCSPYWSVTQAKPATASQLIWITGMHHLLVFHHSWPNIPCLCVFRNQQGPGGAQWVKALAKIAWWLECDPETHITVGRENQFHKVVLSLPHVDYDTHNPRPTSCLPHCHTTHIHTHATRYQTLQFLWQSSAVLSGFPAALWCFRASWVHHATMSSRNQGSLLLLFILNGFSEAVLAT